MTPQQLDEIFPFIVLFYGVILTFVLNQPQLMKLAEQRFPAPVLAQMRGHRLLALVCLLVGTFWSLQNIWF